MRSFAKASQILDKPYAKYFNPTIAPLPEHVAAALAQGCQDPRTAFCLNDSNLLLNPGYLPLETGMARLDSGEMFVAVLTRMPKISGAMIDWWFGWHAMENERYQLWHPQDHVANHSVPSADNQERAGGAKSYVDTTTLATEYVGARKYRLSIRFLDPAQFLDVTRFAASRVATAICTSVSLAGLRSITFGHLIHLVRETDDGCEMRSRFWLGAAHLTSLKYENWVNAALRSLCRGRLTVNDQTGKDMLVHCAQEMNHLASFLPRLYAEYKNE